MWESVLMREPKHRYVGFVVERVPKLTLEGA